MHVSHASQKRCRYACMLVITRGRGWAGVKPTCLNQGERCIAFVRIEADVVVN